MAFLSRKLLVELDCLLDTRLGTLDLIEADLPLVALGNDYHNRLLDDWYALTNRKVSNASFKEHYAKRDSETLKVSAATGLLKVLRKMAKYVSDDNILNLEEQPLEVVISLHPYILTDSEKEAVVSSVGAWLPPDAPVSIVDINVYDLTPGQLDVNWDGVILYDFDRWFTKHGETLNTKLIPRNSIFAPALFVKKPEAEDDLTMLTTASESAFSITEKAFTERIDLNFLNPSLFSILKK